MTYSIIGILAAIILVITNRDVFLTQKTDGIANTRHTYCWFLLAVLSYYVTDALWGIFDEYRMTKIQFADTTLYFAAMAAAVLLWTQYVVDYLERGNIFDKILKYTGWAFFGFEIIVITLNIFHPVMFWFDKNGVYHAESIRHVTLAIQILMFLLTSAYTLHVTLRTEGKMRRRNLTIGLFGIAMIALIALQILYPLWPFYAMGYMVGTCLLHTFVVEDEKEEYRRKLEKSLLREQSQKDELAESKKALVTALAEAERANKAKTVFLSNMSHEIRTPMNAILGLNTIAANDPTASSEVKKHLEKIGISARHLLEIINDILDMSRIESGRMTLRTEPFTFSRAIDQVNSIIGGQCKDKGLAYKCTLSGQFDECYTGDAMKLKQILINILGNAVKFTPEGGSVNLEVEEDSRSDGKVVLKFVASDTGIGISKEFLPHIFDTFSQENSSAAGSYGSTGLGMAITKSIVELMNGTISVESEKGKGTTFTVTVTLEESAAKTSETAGGEEAQSGCAAQNDSAGTDLTGCRILLAEDVPVNAEIVKMILGMRKIEVDTAENGKIATEMFAQHDPGYYAAILMDMRMPVMDGLEAARTIRSMERSDAGTIPIIALTANAFDDDVQRSMQAGLNAHLSKPIEPPALFGTLEKLIKQPDQERNS
ncbi:response regulator [bacterium]|nr:response regulator [bacterium]